MQDERLRRGLEAGNEAVVFEGRSVYATKRLLKVLDGCLVIARGGFIPAGFRVAPMTTGGFAGSGRELTMLRCTMPTVQAHIWFLSVKSFAFVQPVWLNTNKG